MPRFPGTLFVLVLLAAACSSATDCPPSPAALVFNTAHGIARLHVDVASTPEEQQRGLAGRSSLGADDGMAFVFDGARTDPFWMKDTTIPLSIAFWDGSGRVVDAFDMAPCAAEPCRRYRSSKPYVGAAEANQGWFAANDIGIGDPVTLRAPGCA